MPSRRGLSFVLLALTAGCNTEYDNPFESTSPTVPPRADADIVFTSNSYSPRVGSPRDIFSVAGEGAGLVRLSFCNSDVRRCDTVEAAPAPDRKRMALRRVTRDTNGDGRLSPADGEALLVVDLARGVEGTLLPATDRVSGIDWSPTDEVLVFSAAGEGGLEDLYRADTNGQNRRNLTCLPPPGPCSPGVRERRPRIDPTGSMAVFERIDATAKGQVWIFDGRGNQFRVTSGGPGEDPLPGTPYVVGSDADPDYSPDGGSIVFRRLTGLGSRGLGNWDVLTVRRDGSSLAVVASGNAFRGPPDWGARGIVFGEIDPDTGASRLVVVQPDGSGRRVAVTLGAGFDLSFPRWLK